MSLFGKKNYDKADIYGVIGLGRFGSNLAKTLHEQGKDVIALDKDEEAVKEALAYTDVAYVTKNLDKVTLENCGIKNCDTVVVCIGTHIDVSILTTMNVISLGVKNVIAKATNDNQGAVLEKIGATVVYPEHDMAVRLAHKLVYPSIMEYISLNNDIDISEIKVTEKIHDKSIIDIDFRKRFGVNIIAIEQKEGGTSIEVRPDTVLKSGDSIVVIGTKENIYALEDFMDVES